MNLIRNFMLGSLGTLVGVVPYFGCGQQSSFSNGNKDDQTIDNVVCDSPYIRHGDGCCLDQNDNNICDSDEDVNDNLNDNSDDELQTYPIAGSWIMTINYSDHVGTKWLVFSENEILSIESCLPSGWSDMGFGPSSYVQVSGNSLEAGYTFVGNITPISGTFLDENTIAGALGRAELDMIMKRGEKPLCEPDDNTPNPYDVADACFDNQIDKMPDNLVAARLVCQGRCDTAANLAEWNNEQKNECYDSLESIIADFIGIPFDNPVYVTNIGFTEGQVDNAENITGPADYREAFLYPGANVRFCFDEDVRKSPLGDNIDLVIVARTGGPCTDSRSSLRAERNLDGSWVPLWDRRVMLLEACKEYTLYVDIGYGTESSRCFGLDLDEYAHVVLAIDAIAAYGGG